MQEETNDEFKLNSDDPDPDLLYQEELKELRVEKLSHRITLIAILLPFLLGVILYFGYRDLTGRVSKSQDTGSLEIQRLSREVEDLSKQFNDKLITFSTTLSSHDKDFETSVSEKLATLSKSVEALKKSIDALQNGLKQTDSTIKALDATKADKKTQEMQIAKITTALEPLEKEVQTLASLRTDMSAVSSDIQRLENTIAAQLSDIVTNTEQSRKDANQLQASMAALSSQKIDKDLFELELLKLRKNYQQLVSQAVSNLNSRLDVIQKKVDNIQKASSLDKQSGKASSGTTVPTGSAAKAPEGSETKAPPPTSGTIVEQDIPE